MVVFYSAISLACEQALSRAGGMRGRGWWREGKETQNTRRTIECVQALFPLPLSTPPPRPPPRERACSQATFSRAKMKHSETLLWYFSLLLDLSYNLHCGKYNYNAKYLLLLSVSKGSSHHLRPQLCSSPQSNSKSIPTLLDTWFHSWRSPDHRAVKKIKSSHKSFLFKSLHEYPLAEIQKNLNPIPWKILTAPERNGLDQRRPMWRGCIRRLPRFRQWH